MTFNLFTGRVACFDFFQSPCLDFPYHTMSDWSAQVRAVNPGRLSHPVPFVVVHHLESAVCGDFQSCAQTMRDIQTEHMSRSKELDPLGASMHFIR